MPVTPYPILLLLAVCCFSCVEAQLPPLQAEPFATIDSELSTFLEDDTLYHFDANELHYYDESKQAFVLLKDEVIPVTRDTAFNGKGIFWERGNAFYLITYPFWADVLTGPPFDGMTVWTVPKDPALPSDFLLGVGKNSRFAYADLDTVIFSIGKDSLFSLHRYIFGDTTLAPIPITAETGKTLIPIERPILFEDLLIFKAKNQTDTLIQVYAYDPQKRITFPISDLTDKADPILNHDFFKDQVVLIGARNNWIWNGKEAPKTIGEQPDYNLTTAIPFQGGYVYDSYHYYSRGWVDHRAYFQKGKKSKEILETPGRGGEGLETFKLNDYIVFDLLNCDLSDQIWDGKGKTKTLTEVFPYPMDEVYDAFYYPLNDSLALATIHSRGDSIQHYTFDAKTGFRPIQGLDGLKGYYTLAYRGEFQGKSLFGSITENSDRFYFFLGSNMRSDD